MLYVIMLFYSWYVLYFKEIVKKNLQQILIKLYYNTSNFNYLFVLRNGVKGLEVKSTLAKI